MVTKKAGGALRNIYHVVDSSPPRVITLHSTLPIVRFHLFLCNSALKGLRLLAEARYNPIPFMK